MLRELFARLAKLGVRQTLLVVLVTGTVVAGAGFGLVGTLTADDPAGSTAAPTAAPAPPDPTVTPQSTTAPTTTERTTETVPTDAGGSDAGDTSPSTPRATTTTRPAPPNATLSLSASDPPGVRNEDGTVERVVGNLTGTLDWNDASNVGDVALVVQTWSPDSGWRESRRVAVAPNGTTLAVEDALGGPEQVYAEGERAGEFDVGEDRANADRQGYVSVTAVLFGPNGTELDRTSAVDDFAFRVTNEESGGYLALGGSDGGSSGGDSDDGSSGGDGRPSLRVGGPGEEPTVLSVTNAAPGEAGRGRVSVTNVGGDDGVLRAAVSDVSGGENGFTEPERRVDDSPSAGELVEALGVRIALENETGTVVRYLAGDASAFVPLGEQSTEDLVAETSLAADETLHLVVEWRVDADAGNEIQSDSATLDFEFAVVDRDDGATALAPPTGAVLRNDVNSMNSDITSQRIDSPTGVER